MTAVAGRIGPNCLIRTVQALEERLGTDAARAWLVAHGHQDLTERLPESMVPEADFHALAGHVLDGLGAETGLAVLDRSGVLTAEYLLAHRIPAPARLLLPHLPSRLGLRILARAIGAHAWTFAGSGRFSVRLTGDPVFAIAGCPMCRGRHASRPTCSYYRATFEHLLRRLIHPRLTVAEVACEAVGSTACEFRITLPR